MKNNMDELLKSALAPMDVPEEGLNNQILWRMKEKKDMTNKKKYKRRVPAITFAATCMLMLGTITAFAAYRYLSPTEVAAELQDDALQQAFSGDGAVYVNEMQEIGDYRITLLGSVAGKNISNYWLKDAEGQIVEDRMYAVVAIERADGTPMPDISSDEYGKETFLASCYIEGLDPKAYNIMSMNGGYQEIVRDGIQYRLLEMDNIEMFADRDIYVGVSEGVFYNADAYVYDENTGAIIRNDKFDGLNALFILPVDESKADPAAAETYLKELEQ